MDHSDREDATETAPSIDPDAFFLEQRRERRAREPLAVPRTHEAPSATVDAARTALRNTEEALDAAMYALAVHRPARRVDVGSFLRAERDLVVQKPAVVPTAQDAWSALLASLAVAWSSGALDTATAALAPPLTHEQEYVQLLDEERIADAQQKAREARLAVLAERIKARWAQETTSQMRIGATTLFLRRQLQVFPAKGVDKDAIATALLSLGLGEYADHPTRIKVGDLADLQREMFATEKKLLTEVYPSLAGLLQVKNEHVLAARSATTGSKKKAESAPVPLEELSA